MRIQSLGPYELRRRIGRGGMGTVFEAVHTETGEAAAVKVLSTGLAQEEGFRDRFQAEIDSLRKLRHPNIVRIHGFGEQEDVLFFSMELVDGLSLEEELERGRRFNWRETTLMGIQICRALKHAHDRGVIHRDLKPGNLLLTDSGLVKLSDFGIAKLFGQVGQTAAGGVLGTAEYMAPEQADGRPVSDRADLYSFGGVLYALLARRAPFRAKTLPEMLQLQRFAEPDPVRRYAPDTPVEMERIIAQLLEKDPQKRLPTALVVMRRLEAMQHALSVGFDNEITAAGAHDPFIATSPTITAMESLDELARRHAEDEARLDDVPGEHADDARQSSLELQDSAHGVSAVAAEESASVAARSPDGSSEKLEWQEDPQATSSSRFTTVAEDDHADIEPLSSGSAPIVSLHTAVLVVALLSVGWGVWWFLQPPDPNALYAVVAAAAKEDLEALIGVEDDLSYLLDHHYTGASDPRRAELLELQERIELYHLDRRLQRRARKATQDNSLLPVERAYLEAIRLMEYDGPQGLDRLKSVIALYEHGSDASATTRRCLELARRRLAQHRREVDQIVENELAALQSRLESADQLSATDPEQARRIWLAIVDIYQDKRWAKSVVVRAQELLDGLAQTAGTNDRR